MARTGINKVQVQRARDAVLARGENPSLDAIRIELGNTGSKTTIHRYLREIEEAEGTRLDDQQLLSNTLQDMVARLAAQLKKEAGDLVCEANKRYEDKEARWKQEHENLKIALNESQKEAGSLGRQLAEAQAALGKAFSDLQSEQINSQRLIQQVDDLMVRFADKEAHLKSLEEKHQHARDALDHYRQAAKEQRDQDIRRHEQQIQQLQTELRQVSQTIIVKQGELTQFNKDNARLASELASARKQLGQFEDSLRESKKQAAAYGQQLNLADAQLSAKTNEVEMLREQLDQMHTELNTRIHRQTELEVSLAEARISLTHFKVIAEDKKKLTSE